MSPDKLRLFARILNVFENDSGSPETDYKSIYIYHDGKNKRRQVTLARGFTDDGGNLRKVVERYISKGGQLSETFQARMSQFGKGTLVDDKEFLKALITAASEQTMREAQDEVFNEVYLGPALSWASVHKFTTALSYGVIVDSYLQSGGMLGWLMQKFPERNPLNGGDEKAWVKAYLNARLNWFQRATGALHNCTYRPKFFLGQIEKGNWELEGSIICNGSKIS